MKNQLQLAVLGPPDVRVGGRALKLPTRKALALLTFLIVEGGRHSREQLTDLLWPHGDASRGRAALRNTLTYLRSGLDEAAPEPGTSPRLEADRDYVSLSLRPD